MMRKTLDDNSGWMDYLPVSSLAGQVNSRWYEGRRRSNCDRFLCGPGLHYGENQNGGSDGKYEDANSWSTRGEHAPVGPGGVLAETEWEQLRKRLSELTSEHVCGFDSRSPHHLTLPGQPPPQHGCCFDAPFRWDEERRFPLRCELDAAFFHVGLLLLQLAISRELTFTPDEILAGRPREMAEELPPPLNFGLGKALRRHVPLRTSSAMELWRDLYEALKTKPPDLHTPVAPQSPQ